MAADDAGPIDSALFAHCCLRFVPPEYVWQSIDPQRKWMPAWELYDNEGRAPELVARVSHR
jgi:hypothetical protein